MGKIGIIPIAKALEKNTTLTYLRIASLARNSSTATIADTLQQNKTLKTLVVDKALTDEEAEAYARSLQVNDSLTELRLNVPNLEAARHICESLKKDRPSIRLHLGIQNITVEEIANLKALVKSLKEGNHFVDFDIKVQSLDSFNRIGNEEMIDCYFKGPNTDCLYNIKDQLKELIKILQQNKPLINFLNKFGGELEDSDLNLILQALEKNTKLISIKGIKVLLNKGYPYASSLKILQDIKAITKKNKRLKKISEHIILKIKSREVPINDFSDLEKILLQKISKLDALEILGSIFAAFSDLSEDKVKNILQYIEKSGGRNLLLVSSLAMRDPAIDEDRKPRFLTRGSALEKYFEAFGIAKRSLFDRLPEAERALIGEYLGSPGLEEREAISRRVILEDRAREQKGMFEKIFGSDGSGGGLSMPDQAPAVSDLPKPSLERKEDSTLSKTTAVSPKF